MYIDFEQFEIPDNIFAHRKEGKPKETLKEHSELTKKYLELLIKNKNLSYLIENLSKAISFNQLNLFKKMFYNAIYLHDLGKINPSFQRNKMDNLDFDETRSSSRHSFLSAKKFIEIFKDEINAIEDDIEFYKAIYVLYNFSYQISKHHGKLDSFETFIAKINDIDLTNTMMVLDKLNIPEFELYILNKLLFSLLVSADYYATIEYMAGLQTEDFGLFNQKSKEEFKEKLDSYLTQFSNSKGINKLRAKLFKESEENLIKNLNGNIFYLEAPTGSGKTITSINLALKLLENIPDLNKIFYIFPFNTLVEQTKKVFDDILQSSLNVEVINSITPTKIDDEKLENEETKYKKSYLNRLFFHNPIILTTHISLFNILFGTSKEDNYPLWQLANSVIIIDEIQSYDNNLWWYMIEFFQKYAKSLNIKIIIMSATLPKLDSLLEKSSGFVDLINDRSDYFEDKYFMNRVKLDFSLLENEKYSKHSDDDRDVRIRNLLLSFEKEKDNYQKFLFEFIRKDTAREIYNILKENHDEEFEIYELTGDDNKAYRDYVISQTKQDKKIIIVATQVIEAGVDIDMDIGFKDISTLDGEEQFLGRINRNCKKENSKAYFFYLDDEQRIYKSDNRLEFNLRKKEFQNLLENKDFQQFYLSVLRRINQTGNSITSGLESKISNFKKNISKLDYRNISKTMTLIKSQNFTVFFPFKIDISQYQINEFQNIDSSLCDENGFLDGEIIWQRFKELNDIEDFSQKQVEKSKINSLMQFFTFNLIKYDDNQIFTGTYDEELNGIYYVINYEMFITDDLKFKRKEFLEESNENFL